MPPPPFTFKWQILLDGTQLARLTIRAAAGCRNLWFSCSHEKLIFRGELLNKTQRAVHFLKNILNTAGFVIYFSDWQNTVFQTMYVFLSFHLKTIFSGSFLSIHWHNSEPHVMPVVDLCQPVELWASIRGRPEPSVSGTVVVPHMPWRRGPQDASAGLCPRPPKTWPWHCLKAVQLEACSGISAITAAHIPAYFRRYFMMIWNTSWISVLRYEIMW